MTRFNRMSGMTIAVLEVVRIGLALLGAFFLMVGGSKAYEAYSSQFWPTTTGEITRSAVDATGDFVGNRRYRSSVKYIYSVREPANDGEPLIGTRVGIDPSPRENSRVAAEARSEQYPKGSAVEVYYNPNRPERSLLEPNFLLAYLIRPMVGLLCLGVAISLWKVGRGI